MKKIKCVFLISFWVILLLPLFFFKRGKNIASTIDNRMLSNNPFIREFIGSGDLTKDIDEYLSDRIGFRDQMILTYTVLNDLIFQEMIHPTYIYGEDGYIFAKAGENRIYSYYDEGFINYVKYMQEYCTTRNIPFVFAIEPSKNSVMTDKLPNGYHYSSEWINLFIKDLSKQKINYVDNVSFLKQLYDSGKLVFNKKYNAGHWNDLGAYYGVNNIIGALEINYPNLEKNNIKDFNKQKVKRKTLPVSLFPINEFETIYSCKANIEVQTYPMYEELSLNSQYSNFGYYINKKNLEINKPKILIFQGSYMNGMGYKFFQNSFGEYIFVHAYQNITQIDYFMNLFQPDCVVFETVEYTVSDGYYSLSAMESAQFNPGLATVSKDNQISSDVSLDQFTVKAGKAITELSMPLEGHEDQYVYLKLNDQIYDLEGVDDLLKVSILNKNLKNVSNMELVFVNK